MQKHLDTPLRVLLLERRPVDAFAARIKRARRRNPWYVQALAPIYIGWLVYHLYRIRRQIKKFPTESVLRISYENFVTETEVVERRLSQWYDRPISLGLNSEYTHLKNDAHVYTGNIWLTRMRGMDNGVQLRKPLAEPELTRFELGVFNVAQFMVPRLLKAR